MAELVFHYGVMGGGKTTALILDEYNNTERGKNCIILKPAIDTRHGKIYGWGKIKSRVLKSEHQALYIDKVIPSDYKLFDKVYADEIQFFTEDDIYALSEIVDKYNIDVHCYGLKTDSTGELFKASAKLLAIADKCIELPLLCKCGRPATHHIRYINGKIAENQSGIMVEKGKVEYKSLCRKCWKEMLGKL